jgi:hypothetical protein
LLDANGNVVLNDAGNPISQVTDSSGNTYYVDNQTGARQDNVIQNNSPVTPAAYTAAYQQVFNTPPSPDQVNQAVQAYSGSTIQNAISDLGLVAQQNPQSVAQSGSPPPVIDPMTGQQVVFAPVGNYTSEGQPVTQQQNIVSEGVGKAQGGAASQFAFNAFPATGKPEQYSDYQGVPTVNVDANGNVTAWRTANGQIMTPAKFNAAVANGQNKQSLEPAPLKPPANNPSVLQSLLQGALFIGGAALTMGLGSGIAGSIGAALGAEAGSTAATTIGNAVLQAAKGGISGALSNQNPLISAISAGVNPFVGSGVSTLLQNAGISADIAGVLSKSVSGAASGAGGALAQGKGGNQVGLAAELGGLEGFASGAFGAAVDELSAADPNATPEEQQASKDLASGVKSVESLAQQFALDPALAKALGINTSTTQQAAAATGAPGQTKAPTTATNYSIGGTNLKGGTGSRATGGTGSSGTGSSVTFYGSGSSPGDTVVQIGSPSSQALGSALGIGSPSSATGDTPDPSTGGTPQNVWNQASLRVKDDTGSY